MFKKGSLHNNIQDIFLNTSFGGFIVAPNAHVIVGQAEKDYAGQIYAKRITLHQIGGAPRNTTKTLLI